MAGPESKFWQSIRSLLKPHGHFERVENGVAVGTPDVNYCIKGGAEGWVELKAINSWPTMDTDTLVKIDHFTNEQRNWLERRGRKGGSVWVLLKVGKGAVSEFLLFWWEDALKIGTLTRYELYKIAEVRATVSFPTLLIVDSLRRRGPKRLKSILGV